MYLSIDVYGVLAARYLLFGMPGGGGHLKPKVMKKPVELLIKTLVFVNVV